MLNYVHHVHYVVADLDAIVRWLEQNLGLKPKERTEHEDRDIREALYDVGQTTMQITQPLDPASGQGRFLAAKGPGVYHVAWAVDDLSEVARTLAAHGNRLRGDAGITHSPLGYHTINIDTSQTQGVWFQLAEGTRKATG